MLYLVDFFKTQRGRYAHEITDFNLETVSHQGERGQHQFCIQRMAMPMTSVYGNSNILFVSH